MEADMNKPDAVVVDPAAVPAASAEPAMAAVPATVPTEGEKTTFTKEEMDAAIAAREQAVAAKAKADFEAVIESERQEAVRLSKMTAEEKQKAEYDKMVAELEDFKKQSAASALKNEVINIMVDKKLPVEMADFLMADTAEATKAKIDSFEKVFLQEVQKAVLAKLPTAAPTGGTAMPTGDTSKMSDEEYFKQLYANKKKQ